MELSDITPYVLERDLEIAMHEYLCLMRMKKCRDKISRFSRPINRLLKGSEKLKGRLESFHKARDAFIEFSTEKPKVSKEEVIEELRKIRQGKFSDKEYEEHMKEVMEKIKHTEKIGYLNAAKGVLLFPENEDYRKMFYNKTKKEIEDMRLEWYSEYNELCDKVDRMFK